VLASLLDTADWDDDASGSLLPSVGDLAAAVD